MSDRPDRNVIVLDTETNGVREDVHVPFHIAWWNLTTGARGEFLPQLPGELPEFLSKAQLKALQINRFVDVYPPLIERLGYGRHEEEEGMRALCDSAYDGTGEAAVLVASKPSFDLAMLAGPSRRTEWEIPFAHHPIDLGSYACGVLGLDPVRNSLSAQAVARLCRLDAPNHTADGDVTVEGRSYLLLREAARLANLDEGGAMSWLIRTPLSERPERIERELLVPRTTPPAEFAAAGMTVLAGPA